MTALRQQLKVHVLLNHGATTGYNISDGAGNVVAYKSVFVPKESGRLRTAKERVVYTLGDREFVNDYDGFIRAYEQQAEQQRRDREWDAAAPDEARA